MAREGHGIRQLWLMRLVAITSASKPSIAINATERAIRARMTLCMARPPEPRRTPADEWLNSVHLRRRNRTDAIKKTPGSLTCLGSAVSRGLNLGFWTARQGVSGMGVCRSAGLTMYIGTLAQIECDAEHNFSLCYRRVGTITRPSVLANTAFQWANSLSILAA
jgi:hypothetical protein